MKIAIVAVGYNRPDSMQRLLKSIIDADYQNDRVDLIISIDKGERQQQINKIAQEIIWKNGEKKIRTFSEKQGLRKHILQCGDLTSEYDAVVILEDDLIVSKYYYSYVKQAVEFYKTEEKVAGISLYKHQIHPGVCRPFEPAYNGYDIYFQQFAMSWGQCWTKKMWQQFKKWYLENENKNLGEDNLLPNYIANWNNQSWLKYYMRYIVETEKYFIYPYFSLTTNSSDVGEHCRIPNNDFQVSMQEGKRRYIFPSFENAIKYDVFFERMGIEKDIFLDLDGKKILDLYGNRSFFGESNYVISTQALPYKVIKEIQLKYRPIETNCLKPTEGKGIFIYDITKNDISPKVNKDILTRYDTRSLHWKKLLHLGINGFINAILDKISKIRK